MNEPAQPTSPKWSENPYTENNQISPRTWFLIAILLISAVVVETLYIFAQNRQLKDLRASNIEYLRVIEQPKPDELAEESNLSPDSKVSTVNISSSHKLGWIAYHNQTLGLSFEYPVDQLELKESDYEGQTGRIISVTLISKKTKDLNNRPVELLNFSNTYGPSTYGDINTPESIDSAAYFIQGKKYDVWNFVMGEGSQCGGGDVKTKTIKLKENLIIYRLALHQTWNKDPENCGSQEHKEFTTSLSDLKIADQIIDTVKFEE